MAKKIKKEILIKYKNNLIYYILLFKLIIDIYIKMILFNYIIDNINSELNNFKKNILKIEFENIIIFILKIKYY